MNEIFVSYAECIQHLLSWIVRDPELHSRWLNTLSFLENCGARKIAASEHPTRVKEEILKHAAEEFRHAHYLKRQIAKVVTEPPADYALSHILGGFSTLHYLHALDTGVSRFLCRANLPKTSVKEAAYLLVTYAIELRASELYPIYRDILRQVGSKVTVQSILLEEKEHLEEMKRELQQIPLVLPYIPFVCTMEATLCRKWLEAIDREEKKPELVSF